MTDADMTNTGLQRQILTITQLNRRARLLLETHLPLLWVRGEVSNFSRPGSGHWYFTLKDADAQVRCAMFRNRNGHLTTTPKNGDQVLVRGRVGLYENRGDYQLIAEHLEFDGAGLLQQRFEALKVKLQDEGLFDPARKRPLPSYPLHIGVITSPTGAAVRDILHVLKRRCPWVEVSIFPSAVQGQEAIGQIIAAIEFANSLNNCDALIVARGGGSMEDLWAFNEEAVARAIFASDVPVISAVGHETDFTIADFVADVRAPTPSAAAEIISPDMTSILSVIRQREGSLIRQLSSRISHYQHLLTSYAKRLRSPADKLREQTQQLDHLEIRLLHAWRRGILQRESALQLQHQRLQATHPEKQLKLHQQALQALTTRLERSRQVTFQQKAQRLGSLAATLNAVSPLNTLERGYAIAMTRRGAVVQSVGDVATGEDLSIRIRDGFIHCAVSGTEVLTDTRTNDDYSGL
jgi:exodeoxyribonuclease VII large subunit